MADETDALIPELEASVRGEEESRLAYEGLAGRASRPETRQLAERLAAEEAAHRDLLLTQFEGRVDGGRALAGLDPAALRASALSSHASAADLLAAAVEKERDSESRYKFLAERYGKGPHWVLFLQLAEQEREHKSRLQRELDALGILPW